MFSDDIQTYLHLLFPENLFKQIDTFQKTLESQQSEFKETTAKVLALQQSLNAMKDPGAETSHFSSGKREREIFNKIDSQIQGELIVIV